MIEELLFLFMINCSVTIQLAERNHGSWMIDNSVAEAKKIEDILKQQLSEKKVRCESLEEEIVKNRKEMEKFKGLYHQNLPSIKAFRRINLHSKSTKKPKFES
jgi:hypothetical protein